MSARDQDGCLWLYTIEASDCSGTGFSCVCDEVDGLPWLPARKYHTFHSVQELQTKLDGYVYWQNLLSRDDELPVLQISVHGSSFRTLSFGDEVVKVDDLLPCIRTQLLQRSVILLNQCWGGWPTWARLFDLRTRSPQYMFGSIKRYGTCVEALNRAETKVLQWLHGTTELSGMSPLELVDHIHSTIGSEYEGHAEFYRVWYWSGTKPDSHPKADGTRAGMPEFSHFHLKIDDCDVHLCFPADEPWPVSDLVKAKDIGTPLTGHYSSIKHPPHTPNGQYHLHVFCRRNKFFVINQDGTSRDGPHGVHIPKKVAQALREKFPNFILPANRFVKFSYVISD